MKSNTHLFSALISVFLLSSCGGGGGDGSSGDGNSGRSVAVDNVSPKKPEVSVTGPSTVWSDDYYWSANATVSGMDLNTVAFSMTGSDESIDIDTFTGKINSSEEELEIGVHRFSITASDASEASATTTYTIESKLNLAGIWYGENYYSDYFEIVSTRNGLVKLTYRLFDVYDEVIDCFGSWNSLENRLNGEVMCVDTYTSFRPITYTANIQATIEDIDYDIILNKFIVTSGELDGHEFVSSGLNFFRGYVQGGNLSPGVYKHSSEIYGNIELIVNADGSFNTLSAQGKYGSCQISGIIVPDPLYEFDYFQGVYSAKLTATGCILVYNQSNEDAIAVSHKNSFTPAITFMTPGNSELNDGFNATSGPSFVQVCDEQNQLTTYGMSNNVSCSQYSQ